MDYFFMSREDEKASKKPLLVITDEITASRYAGVVGCKGAGELGSMDWLIEGISNTFKSWDMPGERKES